MKHLIASFESIIPTHFNTLLEMYTEKAFYKYLRENNNNCFGEPFEFIADHFYRFDIDKLWTIDEIIERTELAVRKYGVKTLVIDPYNRLNNKIMNNREDLYVGSILAKLSMLAKRLDILVIFVAHPKKPDGEKCPNMYSISGSGDWYNMADYGIIVHRDRTHEGKLTNMPTIFVEKVKNYFLGNPSGGEMVLRYDTEKRTLCNVV
jgi:twinkle protein